MVCVGVEVIDVMVIIVRIKIMIIRGYVVDAEKFFIC